MFFLSIIGHNIKAGQSGVMQYILSVAKAPQQNTYTKTQLLFINKLIALIDEANPITSLPSFNSFIRDVVIFAKKQYRVQILTPLYDKELRLIEDKHELTQKTLWGGIYYESPPVPKISIKKHLIIKPYGIMGLEKHETKEENITVLEGVCLILRIQNDTLLISLAKKGDTFSFFAKTGHGIIALTKTVIAETSKQLPDDVSYILKASQIM